MIAQIKNIQDEFTHFEHFMYHDGQSYSTSSAPGLPVTGCVSSRCDGGGDGRCWLGVDAAGCSFRCTSQLSPSQPSSQVQLYPSSSRAVDGSPCWPHAGNGVGGGGGGGGSDGGCGSAVSQFVPVYPCAQMHS